MQALIAQKLMWHPNLDIQPFVVSCLSEITRITAPFAPYDAEKMKIFLVTRRALNKLYGASGNVVKKDTSILHNIAKVRSCLLMLDLGCDEIVVETFEIFSWVIGSDLPRSVILDMEMIMTLVIEESDEISKELLACLLNSIKKETRESMPRSWELRENILKRCAGKLKACLPEIVSLICQGTLESDQSTPCKKFERAYKKSGKMAIKEEIELKPATNKRSRRPNSLMRPEEGYSLLAWSKDESTSGEEEMKERSAKVSRRPLYINEYGEEQVGKKIRVWWPLNQTFSECTIFAFDPTSMTHTLLHDDGTKKRWIS